ncbi:hypothetical protein KY342_04480 [Candidatus Woesearchaeota archaeon]|nr:hypothetical protein [Candidatus Woesearchaeota archaeon]
MNKQLIEKYLGESNRKSAYKEDLSYAKKYKKNPFYVDEEDGVKYIFGMGSGFSYSSPINPKKEVEKMWKEMKNKLKIK